ncbi:MAG: Rsd/AlgQ family anti-sigma factor [bacterium]|nr:Rsd/AlgQ family anti-sigma factor [bacterium]
MLIQSNGPEHHSRRVDGLVQHWLQDRQALMMTLRDGLQAFDVSVWPQRIQALCEALMDYVSAGHFEIYDELLAEAEQRGSRHLAAGLALYPHLQATTDAVLQFNDRHEGPGEPGSLERVPLELAELLPALERRFEIEDRMIALLHEGHETSAV